MSENTITTAAVTFDVAEFRNWLDTEDSNGRKVKDADPFLSVAYTNEDGEAEWAVCATLSQPGGIGGWLLADGVNVRVHPLAGAESDTAGVVAEVQVDGTAWLSTGVITPGDLVPVGNDQILPGYEAVIIALEVIADRVNSTVTAFRDAYAPVNVAA